MIGQIKNPSFIEGLLGVPTTGLEPVAYGLEIRCSIQLSYVGILMLKSKHHFIENERFKEAPS